MTHGSVPEINIRVNGHFVTSKEGLCSEGPSERSGSVLFKLLKCWLCCAMLSHSRNSDKNLSRYRSFCLVFSISKKTRDYMGNRNLSSSPFLPFEFITIPWFRASSSSVPIPSQPRWPFPGMELQDKQDRDRAGLPCWLTLFLLTLTQMIFFSHLLPRIY